MRAVFGKRDWEHRAKFPLRRHIGKLTLTISHAKQEPGTAPALPFALLASSFQLYMMAWVQLSPSTSRISFQETESTIEVSHHNPHQKQLPSVTTAWVQRPGAASADSSCGQAYFHCGMVHRRFDILPQYRLPKQCKWLLRHQGLFLACVFLLLNKKYVDASISYKGLPC